MTLALIFIYPLLVIGALGLAFGGSLNDQRVNVALFVAPGIELGDFSSEQLVKVINDTNKINIQRAESTEEAIDFVKRGKSDFAFIIKKEKTSSGQVITDFYLDNSNMVVSGMFAPIAKAAIQLTSFEVSSKIITRLWGELLPVENNLKGEQGKISLYLVDLNDAEKKIDSLQQKMAGINVSALQGKLDNQAKNVSSAKAVLRQFNSDFASFKTDLADTRTSIDSADAKLAKYHEKISTQVSLVQHYRDSLASYEQRLDAVLANPLLPADTKVELQSIKNQMGTVRTQIDSSIGELTQVKTDIEDSQQMLANVRQKVNSADARLDSEKQSLESINSQMDTATSDISGVNSQLGSLDQSIKEINSLVAEAKATKQDISEKLKNSQTMLENFTKTLLTLSNVNPAFLSHPINAFEKNIYGEITTLAFITPISLGLVLLLTCLMLSSVSIITEKKEGAHLRMLLSTTSPAVFIIGKIIGQMLFAFLASGIILLIAVLAFGVSFNTNLFDILAAITITSFSFISLGLFITNFTKTQSSAILGSLIVILPMIFLSGTILPLQLMSPVLQFFSAFLPLTAANSLLSGVLVRGLPLVALLPQILILALPATIMAAYTIKKF